MPVKIARVDKIPAKCYGWTKLIFLNDKLQSISDALKFKISVWEIAGVIFINSIINLNNTVCNIGVIYILQLDGLAFCLPLKKLADISSLLAMLTNVLCPMLFQHTSEYS